MRLWIEASAENPATCFGASEEFGKLFAFYCSQDIGFTATQNVLMDGRAYPGNI